MTSWSEGYNADLAYVDNVYHELSPDYLAFVALLTGVRPPRTDRAFRYCELGCGMATGLNLVAATHAHGRFVGIDFDPVHIGHARCTAQAAGLTNVEFREESFREAVERLRAQPGGVPDDERFDFVVMHGVYSWISTENRQAIVDFLSLAVRPGGLVYVSYNCRAGWAPIMPLQRALLRYVGSSGRGDTGRIDAALAFLGELKNAGTSFFTVNPAAAQFLQVMASQNRHYLAHEYLNEHWDALDYADVAAEFEPAKLTFVGSATIPYNQDDLCLPPAVRERLAGIKDRGLIEMVRDFATNRNFRRDLFIRGAERLSPAAMLDEVRRLRFMLRRPRDEARMVFPIPLGELRTDPAAGEPLLDALAGEPVRFTDLETLPSLAGQSPESLMRSIILLVSSGQCDLASEHAEASREGALRLNREIGRRIQCGEDQGAVAVPLVGGALTVDAFERLTLAGLLSGCAEEVGALTDFVVGVLRRNGAAVTGDSGQVLTDPQAVTAHVAGVVDVLVRRRVPLWRRLGAI